MRRRGEIFARAVSLIYLTFSLLVAYSLSTGTRPGFRYRTHLVAVAICIVVALWHWRTERAARPLPTAAPERVAGERYVPSPT